MDGLLIVMALVILNGIRLNLRLIHKGGYPDHYPGPVYATVAVAIQFGILIWILSRVV